jgi:hypothetical protein
LASDGEKNLRVVLDEKPGFRWGELGSSEAEEKKH